MKAQAVRILDVALIGPLMVWGGVQLRKAHPLRGDLLTLLGIATVWYNGRNYLLIEQGKESE
jgi:hypothetical protein